MVYLEKGTEVGKLTLVSGVVNGISEETVLGQLVKELRDDLEKLLEECNLDDKDQKREIVSLSKRDTRAFMQKGEPVGRTDKVLNTINTRYAVPFKIPYRRLQLEKELVCKEQIADQLENDTIVTRTSPWSSPVCMVTKKDGNICFCPDYRKLNVLTKKNSYPLTHFDETLDSLAGDQYFCTLKSGYWQIGMNPAIWAL